VIRMTFPPEWHTLGREAELAAEQLAIGVTALGAQTIRRRASITKRFSLSLMALNV
jgi:hypothetical protein